MRLLGTKRVRMTPDLAQQFLDRHPPNNGLYWPNVREYAQMMREGRWNRRYRDGNTILIDQDARVINGNHRMRAIVESGATLVLLVQVIQMTDPERARLRRLSKFGVDV